MARGRREQGTVRGAKLRPRDLATEDLELVAQDEQLDVLDVQATATANECPQQSPEREVEKREGHRADPLNPAREGRDTSIDALHGAAFVDFSGGAHLFAAITAALFQRERTGRGQIVEVSMHDTVYPMLASSLGGLHNHPDRELPERTGNRHTGMAVAPYNLYATSDGWLAIICMSERHWRGLATAMGRKELIDDPRFRTAKDRVANIDAVDEEVSSHTRARTRDELARDLQAAGVPCAPVKSIREVDTDEHLIERGMIRYVEHAARGRVPVPGGPLRLSDSPVGRLRPAQPLGQSTAAILAELADSAGQAGTEPEHVLHP
jgi:crotonobetainyl-CoA:carnitine CoA-transferase CaiB-like acyl-CoA transferase